MKVLIFMTLSIFVSTSSANDLAAALGAALQEAEKNHTETQVALEVDADKIEKAKFRRHQDPRIVNIRAVADVDRTAYSAPDDIGGGSPTDVDDTRAIQQEVNDN